jgi:hypothetical protein
VRRGGKGIFLQELGRDSLWNTKRLYKVVKIEPLGLCVESPPPRPSRGNEDDSYVRQGRGFQRIQACSDVLAQLERAPLFVKSRVDFGARQP